MEADAANRSEKFSITFFRTLLFITTITLLFSCNKAAKWIEVDSAFSRYIDAYSTGTVSKTAAIRIQLASTANTIHAVGDEVKEKLFEFSPSVKGKAVWIDASTVEFRPDEWLKPNQLYEVNFNLGKVTSVAESKLKEFKFSLKTVKPT